jgi:hypothetical protein
MYLAKPLPEKPQSIEALKRIETSSKQFFYRRKKKQ